MPKRICFNCNTLYEGTEIYCSDKCKESDRQDFINWCKVNNKPVPVYAGNKQEKR